MLNFYKSNGEKAGILTHPDELQLFTDQDYHVDPGELELWQIADKIKNIKAEAERRILAFASIAKQVNASTRANQLLDIWRVNGVWTDEEQAEHDSLTAGKNYIDSIRQASNDLELMEPIPDNFADDQYWP